MSDIHGLGVKAETLDGDGNTVEDGVGWRPCRVGVDFVLEKKADTGRSGRPRAIHHAIEVRR